MSKEIKAIVNRKTGKTIEIPENQRPTLQAFRRFKRPPFYVEKRNEANKN